MNRGNIFVLNNRVVKKINMRLKLTKIINRYIGIVFQQCGNFKQIKILQKIFYELEFFNWQIILEILHTYLPLELVLGNNTYCLLWWFE